MNDCQPPARLGLIAGIVEKFLTSQLSVILLVFALFLGSAAIIATPREEDPQIVVPLADVFVQFPGASAEEVEKLVATPLERLLWQIEGVEYVYSMSRRDMAIVTVRFFVGQDMVQSLVRLNTKISMNIDAVPPGVRGWVIKPVEIDDVPIVNLTLYSDRYDDHELHRIGQEVLARLESIEDISRTGIVGGRTREIRVELDPERMAGLQVSPLEVQRTLQGADVSITAGSYEQLDRHITVSSDAFITSVEEVGALVVGVHDGRPVQVRDVARLIDGPEEVRNYSRIGFSHHDLRERSQSSPAAVFPAVTLALAKKKGTNAVDVAQNILDRLEELQRTVIPDDVRVEVTRNYGRTADAKVDDLLSSLFFAIITVVGLIAFTMGWREGLVVAVSVPVSFALSLFVNYMVGYTINRVTLFALILSLGLVVDDPVTNVDNIQRHILMRKKNPHDATLYAVNEVLPPVIISTLAIIVSFAPMFFITGMMGPYMAPMAINVPLAVTFSTVGALTVVPWLAYHLLKRFGSEGEDRDRGRDVVPQWVKSGYRRILEPFLESRFQRTLLLTAIVVLLLASASLALLRLVPLKMLPFDNKSEFQIVVDMPEGTTLEATNRVVTAFEAYLRQVPEVTHFVSYVGTSSPIDFNGLVRHYYLRQGPNVADIRINLADKERRRQQSHEIVLRLRNDLEEIARRQQATIQIVETPPGPPVLATIVAEIYGAPDKTYAELIAAAQQVKRVMAEEPGVTDIDDTVETPRNKIDFLIDKQKAAVHGVHPDQVVQTLQLALSGVSPSTVHLADERQPLLVRLVLPREERSGMAELSRIVVKTRSGHLISLGEIGNFVQISEDQTIYHKNLERVVYVYGEMAGRAPAEAILDMQAQIAGEPLPDGLRAHWSGEGEWQITLQVFRDLGIAFGVALLGIYLLLIIQTGSYLIPLVIMSAIPLTLIGIMPGFWLLNLVVGGKIGGYQSLVFFTATSMIGMIALGGIVVRNSVVLIEFIDDAVAQGLPFKEAILESGAVRLRPILLTAATTALGAWPITLDPIFSGLAWALIFGLFASTLFTLVVVPTVYYMIYGRKYA
ncbi:efflux RND transporter permease subunit [Desulfoferrobacter suflitae]|uniref:efflux RND transporter permease subunit n=1 Tax=Desulfoferrobacter suflitae TaxID=2865782 RepID=UPI002164BDCB|nr:efflux RND transporter permease subunit [Desulfoferrobacter suflitae]MCK8601323.1 efflux RND transporter permease subunit [Desulfoferrobacter suflitae]